MKLLQNLFHSLNLFRRMPYYAVARGRDVGVFDSWTKCEEQVKNYKGARFKKFPTIKEAENYIKTETGSFGSNSFDPIKTAVSLGSKTDKPSNCKDSSNEAISQEFWPKQNEVSGINDIEDTELLSALAEVEGLEPTTSNLALPGQKRKASDGVCSIRSKAFRHNSQILVPSGTKNIGSYEFEIDNEGYVIAYTDGSCINNGSTNAVAGYGVFFGDNHPLNASEPVKGRVTNNAGEIQASIHALKIATDLGIKKLCISTDSQFLINSVISWMSAWKSKGWRLKSGGGVKNVEDFKILDKLLSNNNLLVKWNYVKAHKGIKGNEMADELAKKGSDIYRQIHLKK